MDRYAKAVSALLAAFLTQFAASILDQSAGGQTVVGNEWVVIIVGSLAAGVLVWAVPNDDKPRQ